jgi:hypothetical protein
MILPKKLVSSNIKKAENAYIIYYAIKDMSRKELMVTAMLGWNYYQNLLSETVGNPTIQSLIREITGRLESIQKIQNSVVITFNKGGTK